MECREFWAGVQVLSFRACLGLRLQSFRLTGFRASALLWYRP